MMIVKVNEQLEPGHRGLNRVLMLGHALPEGLEYFSGNRIPEGADPIALAYAGHQFGHFSPQLGDGRALLLGELVAPDGARFDIQLKGSGPTPFSRNGDGKADSANSHPRYLVLELRAVTLCMRNLTSQKVGPEKSVEIRGTLIVSRARKQGIQEVPLLPTTGCGYDPR